MAPVETRLRHGVSAPPALVGLGRGTTSGAAAADGSSHGGHFRESRLEGTQSHCEARLGQLAKHHEAKDHEDERGHPGKEHVAVCPVRRKCDMAIPHPPRLGLEGEGSILRQEDGVGHHIHVVQKGPNAEAAQRHSLGCGSKRLTEVEAVPAHNPQPGTLDDDQHQLVEAAVAADGRVEDVHGEWISARPISFPSHVHNRHDE
mmetsp:Transcript_13463/g.43943  ORF Transcript_13463/g.43943 Transcript_13463/m.43943 type:complete len:203 (-) Transcript_13463:64-672(-)